jgi:uncharacterized protein (UPF0332 family)
MTTWQQLLGASRVQTHQASRRELDDLRAVVERDLRDAAIAGLSADRRFATAYNAVLQLATMVIACVGYRASGRFHHFTTFEALPLAMGQDAATLAAYFDTCRRKRNNVDYDRANATTDAEANELLAKAHEFRVQIEVWVAHHHPEWAAKG